MALARLTHVLRTASKAIQHLKFLKIWEIDLNHEPSSISFKFDCVASNRGVGENDFGIHNVYSSSSSCLDSSLYRGALFRYGRTRFHNMNFTKERRRLKTRGIIHSCSYSTSTSADQQKNLAAEDVDLNRRISDKKLQLGYLVNDVDWQVRRMGETVKEMREVANVQAEAFHQPMLLFDDMFFDFFKAEVLSGLIYRLKSSPPDRYACLVAEQSDNQEVEKEVAGVVDVTVDREGSVLQHLPGAKEYLYVSGIAVLNRFRRKKVATALLKACDALSAIWGFDYLVLRAYEDDYGARKLYSNAGYKVVSGDLPWMTSWIGRRRRVLMVKQNDTRLAH